jgi:hypothetical protein
MALWLSALFREEPIPFVHFSHLAFTSSSDLER